MALVTRMTEHNADEFERLAGATETGLKAVQEMLNVHAASIMAQPQLFRVLVGQLASGRLIDPDTPAFALHRQQVERVMGALVAAIMRGRADGSVRGDLDPHSTASQLWGGLLGIVLVRINSVEMMRRFPQSVNFGTFVEEYIQLISDGLRPTSNQNLEAAQ